MEPYQDLTVLSPQRLDEFFEESELRDSEKAEIRTAGSKNKAYQDIASCG